MRTVNSAICQPSELEGYPTPPSPCIATIGRARSVSPSLAHRCSSNNLSSLSLPINWGFMGNGTTKWPPCAAIHHCQWRYTSYKILFIPGSLLTGTDLAGISLSPDLVAFSTHRLSSASTSRYRGSDGLLNLQIRRWSASMGMSNSSTTPNRADVLSTTCISSVDNCRKRPSYKPENSRLKSFFSRKS